MKKIIYVCLAMMAFLTLMACTTALKTSEVDPWLARVSGDKAPAVNIEGYWQDALAHPNDPFSWGKGHFEQEGSKVTGSIANHNLRGKVSGNTVHLVFTSARGVDYTARLKMTEKGVLRGEYFYPDDREQESGTPMALERVE